METEVKILFTSDLHLGLRKEELRLPESARVTTFKKITSLAKAHDLLIIAGDLIDSPNIKDDMRDLIKAEFSALREEETQIVLTPGIGEMTPGGELAPFIHHLGITQVFAKPEDTAPWSYTRGDQTVHIYGVPATTTYDISKIGKSAPDGFHIGLFHVDFDIERNSENTIVYKLQKNDFRNLTLDFYALGHRHNFKMFKILEKIIGAYPGSPEPASWEETGDRYAISFTVKNNEIAQIRRLSVNTSRLAETTFDCTGKNNLDDTAGILTEQASRKTAQRLVLTGARTFRIDEEQFRRFEPQFLSLDIVDRSVPSLDLLISEFEHEDTIRGEFYKLFKEKIKTVPLLGEIDREQLAASLHCLSKKDPDPVEELLCTLLNA